MDEATLNRYFLGSKLITWQVRSSPANSTIRTCLSNAGSYNFDRFNFVENAVGIRVKIIEGIFYGLNFAAVEMSPFARALDEFLSLEYKVGCLAKIFVMQCGLITLSWGPLPENTRLLFVEPSTAVFVVLLKDRLHTLIISL